MQNTAIQIIYKIQLYELYAKYNYTNYMQNTNIQITKIQLYKSYAEYNYTNLYAEYNYTNYMQNTAIQIICKIQLYKLYAT